MAKRYQPSQRDKLKEHFRDHVYYRLCKMVHSIFMRHTPSIIMSAEDLFSDAVEALDGILTSGDINAERCNDLWSDTLSEYRKLDGYSAGTIESQTEVAMLFYAVMLGLQSVSHSHYRGTLLRTLHGSIHQMWGQGEKQNCTKVEAVMKAEVNVLTQEMLSWMEEYFVSTNSLSKEIDTILGRNKKDNRRKKNYKGTKIENPTINYKCSSQQKTKRVDTVMKLLIHWGDVDVTQEADYFQNAFSGNDLKLNIKWKGDSTFLYFMIQKLLKQPFVEKQKTASAKAIATNIFGSAPNANKDRYTAESQKKTDIIIYTLNPRKKELNLSRNGAARADAFEGYDDAYIAEQVAKAGELSITKDLNKNYD